MQANMGTIGNFPKYPERCLIQGCLLVCINIIMLKIWLSFIERLLMKNDTYLRCLLAVGLKDNGVEKGQRN